ncbi:queuosine precursor transporter [Treponema sp. OMZ 840]|uniref:queuosine precursor transporter n=1 Tax=Treponema sp. OMZ 840 TaxID=244313 RepID=UPI003D8C17BD
MYNELLLIGSVFLYFGTVLVLLRLFKEQGMFLWTVIATITANIEVLILIRAFGMEQTLGNVLFASTFLVTDILSELYGKKAAKKAVVYGSITSVLFIMCSQYWLLFLPSENDWAMESMKTVFSNTPRIMIAGIAGYVISQFFDVWLYHKWWDFTNKLCGAKRKFLWLRNNGSTLISQLINTLIFTWGAFFNLYPIATLVSITLSTYVIYIITSVADTPFVYAARKMMEAQKTDTK